MLNYFCGKYCIYNYTEGQKEHCKHNQSKTQTYYVIIFIACSRDRIVDFYLKLYDN